MATKYPITQVSEIIECSICKESFKLPKSVPCGHTFCLHCLEQYGKDSDPGDELKCPLCQTVFTVPAFGFKHLPDNYIVKDLLQLSQLSIKKSAENVRDHNIACDLCSDIPEKPPAAAYCIVCKQNICHPCSLRHRRQRAMQGHQVVSLEDKPRAEELSHIASSYCQKHSSKEIEYYCYDCKITVCHVCYVDHKLSQHRCSDIEECIQEFRLQLKDDLERVAPYIATSRDEIKQLEEGRKSLTEKVDATKDAILKKCSQLRSLLDSHQALLMAELDSFREMRLQQIEIRQDAMERHIVMSEDFERSCEDMKANVTLCNFSRATDDLRMRVDELTTVQEELLSHQLSSVEIIFSPSLRMVDLDSNLIGQLTFRGGMESCLIIIGLNDGVNSISSDVHQVSLQKLDHLSAMKNIPSCMSADSQACVFRNNVYITGTGGKRPHNETWRLDLLSGDWLRCANMITGRRRHCAAILDSKLYVLGGWASADSIAVSTVECYNIETDSWSPSGNLILALDCAACIAYKNSIYVFGGCDTEDKKVSHVQVFNPCADARYTFIYELMPYKLSDLRAVLWETSAILMHRDICLVHDFETKTWLERKAFKTRMDRFGLVVHNQMIYVAGGGVKVEENETWIRKCTDEIKSVSVLDIIADKEVDWKHHAKLPKPAMVQSYCLALV